jgi:hypothetical protein
MKNLKRFNGSVVNNYLSKIDIGDLVTTKLNGYENSPFHNIKGVVVLNRGEDFLLDLSINGEEFTNYWKGKGNLYGDDHNDVPDTCKWFEKQQLIKHD